MAQSFLKRLYFEFNYVAIPGLVLAILMPIAIYGPYESLHGGPNREFGILLWKMFCFAVAMSIAGMFKLRPA